MRKIILASIMLVLSLGYAEAKSHHRQHPFHHTAGASSGKHRHGHVGTVARSSSRHGLFVCSGCVVRKTLAGIVAVSAANAERIVATINDLWNHGFRGPVHCAAPYGTHVKHSLHHTGNACDMAQYGWGKTHSKLMYHAHAIIASHGMRDGCSFHDCGHIDMGFALARRHYHARYAHRYHHHHYASG